MTRVRRGFQNLVLACATRLRIKLFPDGCEACHGAKGGVPGNENIVHGHILCDHCHAEVLTAPPAPLTPVELPKPGGSVRLYHSQDCCENVYVEDIVGDLDDLIGAPVLHAEEAINPPDAPSGHNDESFTWTFYRLRGLLLLGSTGRYYSESVIMCYTPRLTK